MYSSDFKPKHMLRIKFRVRKVERIVNGGIIEAYVPKCQIQFLCDGVTAGLNVRDTAGSSTRNTARDK